MNKIVAFFVSLFGGLILTTCLIYLVAHTVETYNNSILVFATTAFGYLSGTFVYSMLQKKYKFE